MKLKSVVLLAMALGKYIVFTMKAKQFVVQHI